MGGCVINQRCVAYQNQVTVTYFSCLAAHFKIPFHSISPILFDIGPPNLMGGCVIAQRCVVYQNQVTVTYFSSLTAVTSKLPSAAYPLYYLT